MASSWKKAQNIHTRTSWGFWNVLKSAWFPAKKIATKVRDLRPILNPHPQYFLNPSSSIFNPWSSITIFNPNPIIILNTSSILILNHIPILILNHILILILNSCSKIATKVRDHRPKMSSKVLDSGQNVRTRRVQLFPALPETLKGVRSPSNSHEEMTKTF